MFDAQLKQSLMTAVGFSEADLAANRSGTLSEAQQEKLRKNAGTTRIISLVTFVIFMLIMSGIIAYVFFFSPTGAALFKGFANNPEMIYLIGGVLGAVILIICLSYLRTILNANNLTKRQIMIAEGNAKLHISKRSGEYYFTSYSLKIGKTKFPISAAVFNSLVEDGNYRVYYIKNPPINMIMSIETM